MSKLSPEAQKATENAQVQRQSWWPTLARTDGKLILLRPAFGGGRSLARFMASQLQEFEFNRQKNWWEAPLTLANYECAVNANSVKLNRDRSEVQLKITEGVKTWREAGGLGKVSKEEKCLSV